ncbi:uncharacterized protein V1516DRAFT_686075 [Lipomyces oligophaga]|uniref:uncharacterized protein n=1 Tax=Lipomyces oligophaga TaxID=45792 RepID=UPI0034CF0C41
MVFTRSTRRNNAGGDSPSASVPIHRARSFDDSTTNPRFTLFKRQKGAREGQCYSDDSQQISIHIENKKDSYSQGDSFSGHIEVRPKEDICVSDVSITLEGSTWTWNVKAGNKQVKRKIFLKMPYQVQLEDLPENKIIRSGSLYTFRFSFVLPEFLLDTTCNHMQCHRLLPSSLGDGSAGAMNDFSPQLARVTYQIFARVLSQSPGTEMSMPYAVSTKIHVAAAYNPDFDVLPHHHFENQEVSLFDEGFTRFYRIQRNIKRTILSRVSPGKITLEACVVRPFVYRSEESVQLLLSLSYALAGNTDLEQLLDLVPQPDSVFIKLCIYTYFSTNPVSYMPHPSSSESDPNLSTYYVNYMIGSERFSGTRWIKESSSQLSFQRMISLTPPETSLLIPNFWSCHVGRQYEVEITLRLSGNTAPVSLRIPIEVTTSATADLVLNQVVSLGFHSSEPYSRVESSQANNEEDDSGLEAVSNWPESDRGRAHRYLISSPTSIPSPIASRDQSFTTRHTYRQKVAIE